MLVVIRTPACWPLVVILYSKIKNYTLVVRARGRDFHCTEVQEKRMELQEYVAWYGSLGGQHSIHRPTIMAVAAMSHTTRQGPDGSDHFRNILKNR